jgi:hypothetical protein
MKPKNIIGWVTFFTGLAIIVWTLYSSYNIFTRKSAVPEFFKITEEKVTQTPLSQKGKLPTSPEALQKEIGTMIGEQLKGILPVDTLYKILNLLCWSTLAWILIFGGAQISSLGIKLLKG